MRKLIIAFLFFQSLLLPVIASETTQAEIPYKEQARISLKNYGLANCLYHGLIKEQHVEVGDIGRSMAIYGPVSDYSYYDFEQDDALNILHNPFKVVADFIQHKRELVSADTSFGYTNLMYQCLSVFNSAEFAHLIHEQDPYIRPQYE